MTVSAWQKIRDHVFLLQDSCNVYAVQGPEGTILINAGTGLAAEHLSEVAQGKPVIALLTHHFRDHTDGALRLHEAGVTIRGPYWD